LKTFSLIALSCFVLVLLLFALPNVLDSKENKIRIETLASEALSLEIHIDGPLDIDFLRGLHLTLGKFRIAEQGQELLVADGAQIGIAMLPLLVGKIEILSIDLDQPNIAIFPSILANLPAEYLASMEEFLGVHEITELSFSGAIFKYFDNQDEEILSAMDCNLQMQKIKMQRGLAEVLLQNLSFSSELTCAEFQYNSYRGSGLKVIAVAADGVINLAPITMQFLDGQGSGGILADFSKATPRYQVSYVLPGLKLKGLLNTLPTEYTAAGSLDLTLNLEMEGNDSAQLMQSAKGAIFLHGAQLTLTGIDLDEKFEKFEFSQNFNLIDAGAFLFAGPLGLLATKGYDFASLLAQSSGNSKISSLISDWKIADGMAQSVDVAMATGKYRVALQGQLDLVNTQFVDVTMAMLDHEGCSLIQQKVHGSFAQPEVDPSQILFTLASPFIKLLKQGAAVITDESCEVFYSGKVAAPE
jgi:hypothetical protein